MKPKAYRRGSNGNANETTSQQISRLEQRIEELEAACEKCSAGWASLKKCAQAAKGSEVFEKCFVELVDLSDPLGFVTVLRAALEELISGRKISNPFILPTLPLISDKGVKCDCGNPNCDENQGRERDI